MPLKPSFIYLASPYSDPYETVQSERLEQTQEVLAKLIHHGLIVYSPISSWAIVAELYHLPTDAKYWKKLNRRFLRLAATIWVHTLYGWENSKGIKQELRYARKHQIPVAFIDCSGERIRYEESTYPHRTTSWTRIKGPADYKNPC